LQVVTGGDRSDAWEITSDRGDRWKALGALGNTRHSKGACQHIPTVRKLRLSARHHIGVRRHHGSSHIVHRPGLSRSGKNARDEADDRKDREKA
jgi:hypothetical protein